jgi:hypothetical protein
LLLPGVAVHIPKLIGVTTPVLYPGDYLRPLRFYNLKTNNRKKINIDLSVLLND